MSTLSQFLGGDGYPEGTIWHPDAPPVNHTFPSFTFKGGAGASIPNSNFTVNTVIPIATSVGSPYYLPGGSGGGYSLLYAINLFYANNINYNGVVRVITSQGSHFHTFSTAVGLINLEGIYGYGSLTGFTTTLPNLTTISRGMLFTGTTSAINLLGTALDRASVDHVIISVARDSGATETTYPGSKSLDLSGGTAAGLSGMGATALAARTALINAGWTVTLNP